MIVPWQQLAADTLLNLIEEFVTRDGTDYGEQEVSLAERVSRVREQLAREQVVIWFDPASESVTLLLRDQIPADQLADGQL